MFMKSLLTVAAAGAIVLAAGSASAALVSYTTSSSYNAAFTTSGSGLTTSVSDPVDWGAFATSLHASNPSNASVPNLSSMTTTGVNGGETITVASGNASTFTTQFNSSTGTWKGDFANNTTVLFTAASSMTLSFGTAVTGLGLDLQTLATGAYGFTMQAFNAQHQSLGSVTSLGATSSGNATTGLHYPADYGTAAFLGITSTAADISYVTITPTNAALGFSIDTSLIYHLPINQTTGNQTQTPEPGTIALLGAGLAALGAVRRRRNRAA
jgi:hypothetical protein